MYMKDINIFMNTTGFYVYVYRDIEKDNIPFYVGKGIKNRYCDVGSRKYNRHLYNKIHQLRQHGYKVCDFTTIEKDGMTAECALDLEIELIKKWGRRDLNTGILLNMTDGGDGVINIRHNPILLDEKDKIFKMYDDGKTLKEIAYIYNCSNISPVLYLFHLFNKSRRSGGIKKPDIDYKQIENDYAAGISILKLSIKYQCDSGTIRKYFKSKNILNGDGRSTSKIRSNLNKCILNNEEQCNVVQLYIKQKYSMLCISRKFNVDVAVIRNILKRNNITIRCHKDSQKLRRMGENHE